MTVTRDVILDLLPLYFAGQVSADTKTLVDEFLQTDPDFARMSQRFDRLVKARGDRPPTGDFGERRALQRTRRLLRYRNQMVGLATAYSLAPFIFAFRNSRIEWILFQDKPKVAIAFLIAAIGCWIAAFVIGRRVKPHASIAD
jgi:hypothetical protein